MANNKKRGPKSNPIPKPKEAAKPIALRPGEKAIPATARVLLAQLDQGYMQERGRIISMIAADLKFPPGAPLDVDFARMTMRVAPPDAVAKSSAKPKG